MSTVWCAAPAVSQAAAEVAKSGAGFQTARATGRCGSGAGSGTTSTTFAMRRKRSRMSESATTIPLAGIGVEDEANRVVLAADAERVDLEASASWS